MPSLTEVRKRNVKRNQQAMKELGVSSPAKHPRKKKKGPVKKATKTPAQPVRRSSRKRTEVKTYAPTDDEIEGEAFAQAAESIKQQQQRLYNPSEPAKRVKPSWDLSEGKRNKQGNLVFPDHPEFTPKLTPKQVIAAGSFGGCYFHPRGGKPGILHKGKKGIPGVGYKEFPADWFKGIDRKLYCSRRYNIPTNKYKVKAGQDQAAWERSGWINPQDPRGWFQWYCRFFCGRRTEDDARQISRWRGVAGPKGRWKRTLANKVIRANKTFDDATVSPVIRQTLLHWAYELTEADFKAHKM